MSEELKPCPFCGGLAELDTSQAYRALSSGALGSRAAVYCARCGADMGFCYEDAPGTPREDIVNQVVDDWNRRAPSPDMREVVEALTAPGGSTTAFTCDQLARLAFVVFYSPVLCAPQNIKAVVDEIDCCPGCDHVSNGGTCIGSERGDYCPNDLAETLRQISVALYGPGNPSHYVESVFGPDQMPVFRSPTGATP